MCLCLFVCVVIGGINCVVLLLSLSCHQCNNQIQFKIIDKHTLARIQNICIHRERVKTEFRRRTPSNRSLTIRRVNFFIHWFRWIKFFQYDFLCQPPWFCSYISLRSSSSSSSSTASDALRLSKYLFMWFFLLKETNGRTQRNVHCKIWKMREMIT